MMGKRKRMVAEKDRGISLINPEISIEKDFEIYIVKDAGAICRGCGTTKGWIFIGGIRPAVFVTEQAEGVGTIDLCSECWHRYNELSLRLWLRIKSGREKLGLAIVPSEVAAAFHLTKEEQEWEEAS